MKTAVVLAGLFTLMASKCLSQNLVLNPSFEDTVPCASLNLYNAGMPPEHWFRPTSGSSDFFSAPPACGGAIPANAFGFQYAHSGNAYVGFGIYVAPPVNESREYITGTLSDSLITGHRYCVSFFASAANNCKFITDDIGAYFCPDTGSLINYNISYLWLTPQIENPQGNILGDTLNWVLISGMFLAQGGEKFITIGNFKNDANTTLDSIPGTIYNVGYYYLDDVSVLDCTVGIEETKNNKIEFTLFPNPAIEKISAQSNTKIKTIEIINTFGEIIMIQHDFSAKQKAEINIASLPKALYILKLTTGSGFAVKKFIKE